MPTDKIQDKIEDLCLNYWRENRRALLLSKLGESLESSEMATIKDNGLNLRQFIEVRLASKVLIHRQSEGSPIIGIVPIAADLPEDITEIFRVTPRPISKFDFLSFRPYVWRAFVSQVPNGQKRWLVMKNPVEFVDQAQRPASEHPVHEVDISKFVHSDTQGKEYAHEIKEWLEKKNIPLENMVRDSSIKKTKYTHDGSNLLNELFKNLNAHDLSRISIPLDIVQKLSELKHK